MTGHSVFLFTRPGRPYCGGSQSPAPKVLGTALGWGRPALGTGAKSERLLILFYYQAYDEGFSSLCLDIRLPLAHSGDEEVTHFRKLKSLSHCQKLKNPGVFLELNHNLTSSCFHPLILALLFDSHRKRYLSRPPHENLNSLWLCS